MSYLPIMAIFIIIVLTLLCLLLIPFHLLIDIRTDGPLVRGWYKLAWFGLPLRKRGISRSACEIMRGEWNREKPETEGEEAAGKVQIRLSDLRALWEALPALARALRELLGSIHIEKFFCHLRCGLSDPADTAVYSGCLWPIIAALNSWGAHFFLQPCFEEEVLEGSLVAELKASLIWFIVPLLKALRKEKVRRPLIRMVRGHRR
jgi:hypothetical protein